MSDDDVAEFRYALFRRLSVASSTGVRVTEEQIARMISEAGFVLVPEREWQVTRGMLDGVKHEIEKVRKEGRAEAYSRVLRLVRDLVVKAHEDHQTQQWSALCNAASCIETLRISEKAAAKAIEQEASDE